MDESTKKYYDNKIMNEILQANNMETSNWGTQFVTLENPDGTLFKMFEGGKEVTINDLAERIVRMKQEAMENLLAHKETDEEFTTRFSDAISNDENELFRKSP